MKKSDLHRALSDISEEYILEASPDQNRKKRPLWRRGGFWSVSAAAAACVVLLVGISTGLIHRPSSAVKETLPEEMKQAASREEPNPDGAFEEGPAVPSEEIDAAMQSKDADMAVPPEDADTAMAPNGEQALQMDAAAEREASPGPSYERADGALLTEVQRETEMETQAEEEQEAAAEAVTEAATEDATETVTEGVSEGLTEPEDPEHAGTR